MAEKGGLETKDEESPKYDTLTHQLHRNGEGYEDCTRHELEQRAGEMGIPGHSAMSREQLIRELRKI